MIRWLLFAVALFTKASILIAAVRGSIQLTGRQLLGLTTSTLLTLSCGCIRWLARRAVQVLCWSLDLAPAPTVDDPPEIYQPSFDPT